ncbi:MAG: D-2-hydroxyacid dehydrogenase family protein [Betaproteobacteria bacterium]|nr:D-2-hydroxyacid dehydrogenase family protein [Betaproteobacteria bacterium]
MKILIPDDYHGLVPRLACSDKLAGHEVTVLRDVAPSFETLAAKLRDADIIIPIRERTAFARALLEQLPKLKLIAQTGRSAHSVDLKACTELGIPVCSGTHASPYTVAEHTWALIFAWARRIHEDHATMQAGRWRDWFSVGLRGKTLGVYGLGKIGEPVAAAGAVFGMRVLCFGRDATAKRARELGYDFAASRAAFFGEADVLSINLRMIEATRHIITAGDLARMKPAALLVNAARAELIAPGALVDALKQGRPGYAAVDVYENEPVQRGDHPLLTMPNVICTPHTAWLEPGTYEKYFGEAFEQAAAFAAGKPVKLLNPDVVPRK